jgi:phosphoribosyl 1,2-cyclic phosphodiesterase
MRVKLWGTRGSVPSPGPATVRYGGNTSCVQVTLSDGAQIVLDAGSGIRNIALADDNGGAAQAVHILLTHLHLDHIQGLRFLSPLFDSRLEVTIWGPASPDASLHDRIERLLSGPWTPVAFRELPCADDFRDCQATEWDIGPARIRAEAVSHRGPTLGFRISEADASLCYLPDHEPAAAGSLDELLPAALSGYALALDADLLLHDGQYSDEQYLEHVGWGHSSLSDAVSFARRANARRTLLFHHDPRRSDDELDRLLGLARERVLAGGGDPDAIGMAAELTEIDLGSTSARASAP